MNRYKVLITDFSQSLGEKLLQQLEKSKDTVSMKKLNEIKQAYKKATSTTGEVSSVKKC